MNIGRHAERSDLKPIVAPVRLERRAPIRRKIELARCAEWIGAQGVLCVGIERAIRRKFEVQHVIEVGIGAHTADMRSKGAVDDRAGRGSGRYRRCGVGETPSRSRVPRILNSGSVIGGYAVGNGNVADTRRVGIADVGIVPGPIVDVGVVTDRSGGRRSGVGQLRERADVVGDGAAPEEAQRRNHQIVVGLVGIGRRRLRRFGIGEADDGHHRDWRHPFLLFAVGRIVGTGKQRSAVRAAAVGITPYLEAPAVRRQAGKIGVTGTAWLPGLSRKARQRFRPR